MCKVPMSKLNLEGWQPAKSPEPYLLQLVHSPAQIQESLSHTAAAALPSDSRKHWNSRDLGMGCTVPSPAESPKLVSEAGGSRQEEDEQT